MAKPRKPELAPRGVYVGLYAAKLEFESKFAMANPSSGEQPRLTRWQHLLPRERAECSRDLVTD
jgi:hypothetical protein